jgi:fructose-1,6-bisphosphatase
MAARTLTQHLLDLDGEGGRPAGYAHILSAIAVAAKLTAAMVSRGPLVLNQTWETRDPRALTRELRRLATRMLLEQASGTQQLAGISIAGASTIIPVGGSERARYLVLLEALHGSLNLSENQTVGLAFSILERPEPDRPVATEDFLQPGSRQVGAGLALYGPSTVLIVTTGRGVDGFTLDRDVGNFVLTHPRLTIPADSHIFAINSSEAPYWPAPVKRYVDECVRGREGPRDHDFLMRWNASAVVGAFRILINGGIFLVPDIGRRATPWGVPLLHNAAPLALLIEQAGGAATTGTRRLLEVAPTSITQRTSFVFGASDEVERVTRYFDEHARGLDPDSTYPLFGNRTLFVTQR